MHRIDRKIGYGKIDTVEELVLWSNKSIAHTQSVFCELDSFIPRSLTLKQKPFHSAADRQKAQTQVSLGCLAQNASGRIQLDTPEQTHTHTSCILIL